LDSASLFVTGNSFKGEKMITRDPSYLRGSKRQGSRAPVLSNWIHGGV